jgi:hypothetical protein
MPPTPKEAADAAVRMRQLLGRWQQSVDLHTRYLTLDDAHYWHVQPWPAHERPVAWVVQLARQKVTELRRMLEERLNAGDTGFAAGLEHMVFLANLVGLQPAGRYIPLADPQNEQIAMLPARLEPLPLSVPPDPPDATPELAATVIAEPAAAARRNAKIARAPALSAETQQVIADAVRLIQWGRKWHELGELISRLADRPTVGDVRRILRTHRARIEATAAEK